MDGHSRRSAEERVLNLVYVVGVNLGVFVMAFGAVMAFALSLARVLAIAYYVLPVSGGPVDEALHVFGIEQRPLPLMLVTVIESTLLAVIMLTFAFGLRAVFLGRCYGVACFDIKTIEELKSYLIGLIVTLVGAQFLEFLLIGGSGLELMYHGIAVAVVIVALGGFSLVLSALGRSSRERGDAGTCKLQRTAAARRDPAWHRPLGRRLRPTPTPRHPACGCR